MGSLVVPNCAALIGYLVDYECEKVVSVMLNNTETILDFVELKNRTVC